MTKKRNGQEVEAAGKEDRDGTAARNAAGKRESDCRCKEAKGKTVGELLRVVVKDLTFWKK